MFLPSRPCQAKNSASPIANNPTAAIVTSIPSSNSGCPKVNLAWPVCKSIPTKPNKSPANKLINPLKAEFPKTAETMINAKVIRLKYSAGPNARATSTTIGAKKVKAMVPIVPAIKLPMAAVASAGPALPFLAILFPSREVTIVADSPGVFNNIEVVEPPYMAP